MVFAAKTILGASTQTGSFYLEMSKFSAALTLLGTSWGRAFVALSFYSKFGFIS
jgi:hypothetical protein